MTGLRKCPFCGAEQSVYMQKEGKDFAVICDYNWGGCGACGGYRETPKDAAEAWNTRAESCDTCAFYYPDSGCMKSLAEDEVTE